MNKFLELLKSLTGKNFATKDEKVELKKQFDALKEDERETVDGDYQKALKLSEEDSSESDAEKAIKSLMGKFKDEAKTEAINLVKTEVKEWLAEQKELMAKGAGVYAPEVKEKRAAMNEYTRNLCKALLENDQVKIKEMTTDASGSPYGGYVVNSELSAEIRHLITEYGVARREMLSLQLTKDSYKANNLVTDVTVYWVDEGAVIGSTSAVLGQVELKLKKLGAIVALTSELLAEQEIDLFGFLASRVAEGFAKAEDEAFFNGDGSSNYASFTGLLKNTNVNKVTMTGTTFASLSYDDLIDMQDATPSGALANSKYYMHRTIRSLVRKLKDDNHQYIYSPANSSGPMTLDGYPLVLVEAMPAKTATAANTSFALFGDLKKGCILGYNGAIVAKRFDAGTVRNVAANADINLITTDREAIRWVERVGYIVVLASAITKLSTAAASV